MVARQLPPLSAAGPVARTSPEYVRISMASAIALRMRSGRFSREFEFGGINLLLSYGQGCRSDCGYCGLARTRPGSYEDKSFIRVPRHLRYHAPSRRTGPDADFDPGGAADTQTRAAGELQVDRR